MDGDANDGDTPARGERAGTTVDRDPHLGRLLDGRYRIHARIARGGMATVYEAHDVRLDRTVAVKIMHAGLGDGRADDDFAARFVKEARAAARLSHPHVVAVYDQGEDDGAVYLAMEYVPGKTLHDVIAAESPMAPSRALALLEPVLLALADAHRAGLIHRDVKPENVLISDDGRVKVADFGLAKAVSADTQHTATGGVLIGTVSYLAPELVIDGRADARADVYAAGVILFEMLTGAKPHTGESPIQVAYRHVHHDIPAPSESTTGLPGYVDALVARATSRDRTLRPADAGVLLHHVRRVSQALREGLAEDSELESDLQPTSRTAEIEPLPAAPEPVASRREPTSKIHDDEPVAAPPPPAPKPRPAALTPVGADAGVPTRRGRRSLVLALVTVLLLAGVAGGGYWYGWARYTTAPSVLGLTQAQAEDKLDAAGLGLTVGDPVFSESVPKGQIVSTDPGPNERILPGDDVTVVLSRGPERYDVPDVTKMTEADAKEALAARKLVAGKTERRWSETIPAGEVMSTVPAFGTPESKDLRVNTSITLVVSKGKQPIKVKNYEGRDADVAQQELTDLGLTVTVVKEKHSMTVPEGDVIRQKPDSGTRYKGDEIELVVSLGPPLAEIPSVYGEATEDAVQALKDLGFNVDVRHHEIYFTGAFAYSTDPGAGEMAPVGSTIILYVV